MENLKIILIDDNEHFRTVFKNILVKEYHALVIGEASNSEEFDALQNHVSADIIFMDVMMPGMDGIALAKKTLWDTPSLKIIAVTMHANKIYLNSLIGVGFKGCMLKTNVFEELDDAVDTVMKGGLYFPDYIPIFEL